MPKILVVDDSATQRTLIASILRDRGGTVITAADGAEALGMLAEQHPDVVVTDMQMPQMNGVELIRRMRSDFPLLPSILVTAFGNEDLAAEALGVGAANYISKDHVATLLPEMVHRIIQFSRANSESLDIKAALRRSSLDFTLDCSVERVTTLVCLQLRLLAAMNVLHTADRIRIAEALDYLIFHCIVHGNLEEPTRCTPITRQDAMELADRKQADEATRHVADRNVTISFSVGDHEARFVIRFDGEGESIAHAPLPGTPQSFSDERGRGMLLLTSVMNEVFIDPVCGDVTLVKYIG